MHLGDGTFALKDEPRKLSSEIILLEMPTLRRETELRKMELQEALFSHVQIKCILGKE